MKGLGHVEIADRLTSMGVTYESDNSPDALAQLLVEAYDLSHCETTTAAAHLARCLFAQGHWSRAKTCFDKAASLLNRFDDCNTDAYAYYKEQSAICNTKLAEACSPSSHLSPSSRPRKRPPPGYIPPASISPATLSSTSSASTPSFSGSPSISMPLGQQMLKRMGWSEGTGLGAQGQGRKEPVRCSDKQPRCKRGVSAHGEEDFKESWLQIREAEDRAKSMEFRLNAPRATEVDVLSDDGEEELQTASVASLSSLADFCQKGSKRAKKDDSEFDEVTLGEDCLAAEEEEKTSVNLDDIFKVQSSFMNQPADVRADKQQISGLVKRELYYKFSVENPRKGFVGSVGHRDLRERRMLDQVLRSRPGRLADYISIR